MNELDENQMRAICIALGWQGGTYWQALEEIKMLRTERAQRLTLAQRVADLEAQRDGYKAAFAEWMRLADYIRGLVQDGTAPIHSLGHHCADVAIETIKRLIHQRDELNHQHHAVRADAQARVDTAVIRALAAEKERDEWRQLASAYSPAKELAASLKQAKASGDAARKERDELRARLAGDAIPNGWRLVPVELTEKMIGEGACASCLPGPHYIGADAARRAYINMLAAAPESKA